ncbi:MAG: helix-turn-helix domain-containing protein [Actinomycetota bacterium]|nr:helix-turn-helix domain-containing protein [Actinomycetota bacterium]
MCTRSPGLRHRTGSRPTGSRPQPAGLTQQALAERVGTHATQVRRYEAGTSAPTLDVLRNTAVALHVSIDSLVFEEDERGPDNVLRLAFEATVHLDVDERAITIPPAAGT